jgi:hypothetical protein
MLPGTQFVFPGWLTPQAPRDMFAALGKDGQILNIVPSQQLVVVRMGSAPDSAYEVPTIYVNDIWRRLNRVICNQTAVLESGSVPKELVLLQNYPNPFNPTTTIEFSFESATGRTGEPTRVTLKVYDVLGREVRTLVNEELKPGNYEVTFDAAGLASGVYIYRLTTPTFSQTKAMVVIK